MSTALLFDQLSVIYSEASSKIKAVDSLSLDIKEGEFFALLGPNGAGKTSAISTVTGLLPLRHGRIEVFGHPAGSLEARRMLGIVPQELVHHGFFSVNEVLNFFSGYYGRFKNQARIDFLLDRLQLADCKYKKVSQLSGGMKRRLLIAKALVHEPRLLLLDEPSAGVDVELRTTLWEFMRELNESGVTIVLTTHYLEEAQRLCKRTAIMHQGKLLALDQTGDLIAKMSERLVSLRLKQGGMSGLKTDGLPSSIEEVDRSEDLLRLRVIGSMGVAEILSTIGVNFADVEDIRVEEGALEHAFMKIIEGSRA